MTFDPSGWLLVAERAAEPVDNGDPEAWYRAAVNRSYYAALMMIAYRVVQTQGAGAFAGERTHDQVKSGLRQAARRVPVLAKVQDQLRILEGLRGSADYVLGQECVADRASEAVSRGKRLVDLISHLNEKYFRTLPIS